MRRLGVVLALLVAVPFAAGHPGAATPKQVPHPLPVPAMSYDGAGFTVPLDGAIVTIARQGTRHADDPTGRIAAYTFTDGEMDWPPRPVIDSEYDDRNPAGGLTRSGALIVFYARAVSKSEWVDLRAARIAGGEITETTIPTNPDSGFSAYGGLVVLPSGKLMQTVYGRGVEGGRTYYRVRAFFSVDDGRTWPEERTIWKTYTEMPNETAAVYVDGRTDATARLVAFASSARRLNDAWVHYVMQIVSTDGGRTWRRLGWVSGISDRGMVPWAANVGGGRLALVTVDRRDYTINVAFASSSVVFGKPSWWPRGRAIYQSTFMSTERVSVEGLGQTKNWSDFGYPSIVSLGPNEYHKFVVFYDSRTGTSGISPADVPADTDLILSRLFALPLDQR
ncbi:MAG TPA: sialidase family protein [Actinomycetota bacterium]